MKASLPTAACRGVCTLGVFLLLLQGMARAENAPLNVSLSRATGLATFVTGPNGGPIQTTGQAAAATDLRSPDEFLRLYGRLFGVVDPRSELLAEPGRRDVLGRTRTLYRQVHKGVPVFSGQLRVHQDAQGRVTAANGDFYPIPERLEVIPARTADEAVTAAGRDMESAKPQVHRAELTIVDPGWYGDPPAGPRLAYYLELEDVAGGMFEAFFVDARSGKILDRWSLRETARERQIHDGLGMPELPGAPARFEGEPRHAKQDDVNRAYDYYGDTYDYFYRAFGRDSMDGLGLPMVATVNSTAPGCPNAFWSSRRLQMAFCKFTVTDDITAHELSHGVTFFTAELIYQNQSGQLNESYSDVFGELVDLFNGDAAVFDGQEPWPLHATGPGVDEPNLLRSACSPRPDYPDGVRWLIAEDAVAFGGSIRDMWDPTCLGDPDRANSPLQTCGPGDNGGVHSGSGIPNHAFVIAADGKKFNGYSVRGIGPIKAAAVWYRALEVYLTAASDFEDAYLALSRSAHDLIGEFLPDPRTGFPISSMLTEDDAEQIEWALQAVEMNGPARCGQTIPILSSEPHPVCGDEQLVYAEDFEDEAPGWTVSNSRPRTFYDWRLTDTPLPYDRPGRAFFCEDPDLGDCEKEDESGLHSLFSPPIALPLSVTYPLLRFTHYMDSETSWDGGTLSVRTNATRWRAVPGEAFHYNTYNTRLRGVSSGNTNPLAGAESWSGVGGKWGTSVVDLSALAKAGDTIELRFDFGKDGCTGRVGWFVDDVAVVSCGDCNFNGLSDDRDLVYRLISPQLGNIGVHSPQSFILRSPLKAAGGVKLKLAAIADLFGEQNDEYLMVYLDGQPLGEFFHGGARDCPGTPDFEETLIPAAEFNAAAEDGEVVLDIKASDAVNPTLCGGRSWLRIFVEYPTTSRDLDGNQVPDECEHCAVAPRPDPISPHQVIGRHISFFPRTGGRHVAYRVRISGDQGDEMNAESFWWVGLPESPSRALDELAYQVSGLDCEPYFSADWDGDAPLYVFGEAIVPDIQVDVEAVDLACFSAVHAFAQRSREAPGSYFSKPLPVSTAPLWGDVAGAEPMDPPNNVVDFVDVAAVVERFMNSAAAPLSLRVDLGPARLDGVVDFSDVSLVLDAYRGLPYPFPRPAACSNR